MVYTYSTKRHRSKSQLSLSSQFQSRPFATPTIQAIQTVPFEQKLPIAQDLTTFQIDSKLPETPATKPRNIPLFPPGVSASNLEVSPIQRKFLLAKLWQRNTSSIQKMTENNNTGVILNQSLSQANLPGDDLKMIKMNCPNIDLDRAILLGNKNASYNCIAYSMGINDQWLAAMGVWGGCNPDTFAGPYLDQGFSVDYFADAAQSDVVWYGHSENELVHAAKKQGNRFTSKLGEDYLIEHDLDDISGMLYGQPQLYVKLTQN